jgi:hypothetical protein
VTGNLLIAMCPPTMRWLTLALLMVAAGTTADAQRTDVVQVTNGDRITGTVSRLERAQLAFRTDAAGTISIAWRDVVTLTSSENLDVELSSGARFSGTLSSPSPGHLVVQTSSGPSPSIDMTEVIRFTPVAANFHARTNGSIDFGLNLATADSAASYTLDFDAANRTRSYETVVDFDAWLQRREDTDTLTRNDLQIDVRRLLPRRWYAVAKVGYQNDDELDLDWRVLAGGGVGRRLVQSNQMLLSVEGGLDYAGESYDSEDSTDHSAELFGGIDWDYFSPTWATETTTAATTYISLQRQRVRLELDAQLRRDIFWDLYWALNVFGSFDSDPPGDRDGNSLGLSFTVGWSF